VPNTEPVTIPIEGDDSDFQKASANTKRSLKEIGSEVSTLSKLAQSEELRNLGQTLGRGFNAAAGEIKALTGEMTDYATEVRKLNYLTGAGAEETSRLIQLSDDLAINYTELGTALKAAANKGIDPSTDSLAKLSDEYLKLNPGVERADWLMEKFGRSGVAIAPLMEQGGEAIRNMSADIDQNMILTGQQIEQMEEYRIAVDNFNDRVQGLRYSVANDLIGAFMALPKPMQDFALGLQAFGPQITGTIGFVGDLAISLNALGGLFKAGGLLASIPTQLAAMGTAVKGFALAVNTAMGPVGWLIAALGLLAVTVQKYGPAALTTFKQMTALAEYKLTGNMPTFAMEGRASGGPVVSGQSYLVGERGPEILSMGRSSGVVVPNNRISGGLTVIIQAQTVMGDNIERTILQPVEKWARSKGLV
jgi:hypothetical protein